MSLEAILIIVLLFVLVGGGPFMPYANWGYGPYSGLLGLLLIIVVISWLVRGTPRN